MGMIWPMGVVGVEFRFDCATECEFVEWQPSHGSSLYLKCLKISHLLVVIPKTNPRQWLFFLPHSHKSILIEVFLPSAEPKVYESLFFGGGGVTLCGN